MNQITYNGIIAIMDELIERIKIAKSVAELNDLINLFLKVYKSYNKYKEDEEYERN